MAKNINRNRLSLFFIYCRFLQVTKELVTVRTAHRRPGKATPLLWQCIGNVPHK